MILKSLVIVMLVLSSTLAFSQKTSVEFGMGRGTFSQTTKQIGMSYKLTPIYTTRVSYSIDNIETPKTGVRQIYAGGFGFMATKELELYSQVAYANDRFKGDYLRNKWGGVFGGTYNFKVIPASFGLSINTLGSNNPLPTFILGYRF